MKRLSILLAILGVALGIGLVLGLGAGKVVHAIASVGWSGFAILLGWQLAVVVVLAEAWRLVCRRGRFGALIFGRLVREGGANILPFSELGGLAFGARAITLAGIPWPRAIASSLADVTAEFAGELPFILFGFIMLVARSPDSPLAGPIAGGCGLLLLAGGAMIWAEKHAGRLFRGIGRLIAQRFNPKAARSADFVEREFEAILARTRRLGAAAGLHLLGWIGGGITVWLAYHLQGGHIGILAAIAVEGLLSAALAIAFLVPVGAGVQEAAYVAIGHLFGMPPELSLGLSLLRRARDMVIGGPPLLIWQIVEARRLRRRHISESGKQTGYIPGEPDHGRTK
jgi:glycosyltransferase 2 family protein